MTRTCPLSYKIIMSKIALSILLLKEGITTEAEYLKEIPTSSCPIREEYYVPYEDYGEGVVLYGISM